MLDRLNRMFLVVCLLFSSLSVSAEVETIAHIKPDTDSDQRDAYFLDLLRLALDRTQEESGSYQLHSAPVQMNQSRALMALRRGQYVDVVWTMTNPSRERAMQPIRIPLMRGLLGIRVPVVREGERDLLAQVDELASLRDFRAGQGHDWPDTEILKANEIPVEAGSSYEGLFKMLRRGRIDYMPRSVTEVWAEAGLYRRYDLAVGEGPLLAYPSPIYFFVSRDNQALAERLELGLKRALADGSFQGLFETHPATRDAIERLHAGQRSIIWLDNPQLPEKTPLEEAGFWFDPVFSTQLPSH